MTMMRIVSPLGLFLCAAALILSTPAPAHADHLWYRIRQDCGCSNPCRETHCYEGGWEACAPTYTCEDPQCWC